MGQHEECPQVEEIEMTPKMIAYALEHYSDIPTQRICTCSCHEGSPDVSIPEEM